MQCNCLIGRPSARLWLSNPVAAPITGRTSTNHPVHQATVQRQWACEPKVHWSGTIKMLGNGGRPQTKSIIGVVTSYIPS